MHSHSFYSLVLTRWPCSSYFCRACTINFSAILSTLLPCGLPSDSAETYTLLCNGTVIKNVNEYTDISSCSLLIHPCSCICIQRTSRNPTSVWALDINRFYPLSDTCGRMLCTAYATNAIYLRFVVFYQKIPEHHPQNTLYSRCYTMFTHCRYCKVPSSSCLLHNMFECTLLLYVM